MLRSPIYSLDGAFTLSAVSFLKTMNDEHTILNHYNLTNPFPTSWPTEKDDSDGSDDDKSTGLSRHYVRRSKSRYSALERHGSDRRSLVPGSEKLPHGQENLVQKDEPDPLGGSDSVVRTLRQKGLPVEDDSRLSEKHARSGYNEQAEWS